MSEGAKTEANQGILREVFPVESELVGTENLHDISAGELEFADSTAGFHMDVASSVELLANAVTVVTFVWTIIATRRSNGLPISPEMIDEVDEMVVASVEESASIFGTKRRALYLAVLKRADAVD